MSLNTPDELKRKVDALTRRIEALDTDILRETNHERCLVLQATRDELAQERETVAAELAMLSHDLAPALPSASVDARLATVERQVAHHDAQLRQLWRRIVPTKQRKVAWVITIALVLACWTSFVAPEIRTVYFARPPIALAVIVLTAFAVGLAQWLPGGDEK